MTTEPLMIRADDIRADDFLITCAVEFELMVPNLSTYRTVESELMYLYELMIIK